MLRGNKSVTTNPKMTTFEKKRKSPFGSISCLEDMRGHCRIDEESGCWIWKRSIAIKDGTPTPTAYMRAGLVGNQKHVVMSAARASWLLSGHTLKKGEIVWRHVCGAGRCINPEHCRAGTAKQMGAAIAATGRNKGDPVRAAINARNRRSILKPVETIRAAEKMIAANCSQREIQLALGLSNSTIVMVRNYTHPNSTGRQQLANGASVFAWRDAA